MNHDGLRLTVYVQFSRLSWMSL